MNERLKKVRSDSKLSTRAFAESLGMTAGAISMLETGKRNITPQVISSVCTKYHVNEVWLRTGEGNPYELSDVDKAVLKAKEELKDEEDTVYKEEFIHLLQENLSNGTARIWYEYAKKWIEEVEKKKPPI